MTFYSNVIHTLLYVLRNTKDLTLTKPVEEVHNLYYSKIQSYTRCDIECWYTVKQSLCTIPILPIIFITQWLKCTEHYFNMVLCVGNMCAHRYSALFFFFLSPHLRRYSLFKVVWHICLKFLCHTIWGKIIFTLFIRNVFIIQDAFFLF